MKVMVTGATGFVGRHVVHELLLRNHSVVAVARDRDGAKKNMSWFDKVDFHSFDLHRDPKDIFQATSPPDALVHLAWPGLPNYHSYFHIGSNLPADLKFLEAAIDAGVPQLMVAGTCLEYGIQHGPLKEGNPTHPTTPYGFAKDVVRKSLEYLQEQNDFTLQWMRLFYMYGEGQNQSSLLAQLDSAIDNGDEIFKMSMGNQLRDYLSVEEVAENFAFALEHTECNGVINCCSGRPVSVLDLVNRRRHERASNIELERGHYPYPDYEPLAFWGEREKLTKFSSPQ